MLHPLRDIAVLFDASDTGNRILHIAAQLAQVQQAHRSPPPSIQPALPVVSPVAPALPPRLTMRYVPTPPAPRS